MTKKELDSIKNQFENNQTTCEQLADLFQILSNKPRFRIVCTLMHGEACVQDIAYVIGKSTMSNISQQLKILRMGGIIKNRRDKKQILYSIADEKVAHLISFLHKEFNTSESCVIPHLSTPLTTE
jgi:DNA-binding transcriptional ArsR family regulator